MLKLSLAVLAVALAGSASAAGWRGLSIDGSNEASFKESVQLLQDKLSRTRAGLLALALQDLWVMGAERAKSAEREFTAEEYFAQVDGLGYKEVIALADPTGEKMRTRRAEYWAAVAAQSRLRPSPAYSAAPPGINSPTYDIQSYNSAMWNTPEQISAREGR